MFDTYQVGPRHVSINSTTHEHCAPTDESVRLLAEMERKAEDRLVARMRVSGSGFDATAHLFFDFPAGEERLRVRFTLGDDRHDFEVALPPAPAARTSSDYLRLVRDEVARAIATRPTD